MKNLKTINGKLLAMLLIMFSIAFVQSCDRNGDDPVPANKTALLTKINEANNLITTTEEGTANGQYAIGSQATLQAVIDNAQTVYDKKNAAQTEVDTSVVNLTEAITVYEGQIISVDKTELLAKINEAKDLIATTEEGTANGQYVIGSQATLQDVIDIAQVVYDNEEASQTEVDNNIVALTNAIAVYEGQIISIAPDALIGHWAFDDGTGTTVKDYSGNGFDGTFGNESGFGTGNPTWATDRYGNADKAIAFNDGAKITVPYNTAINPKQITIALWVNAAEIRENNRFIGLQSWIGYKFQLQSANKPFFTAATDEGADGTIYDKDTDPGLTDNTWYHLAVTFGGGEMVFYVNGVKTVTHTGLPGNLVTVTGHDLVFGVGSSKYAATADNYDNAAHADYHVIPVAWGGYFHGTLDEIRMYNTVLTATQIESIYNLEKPF